jgi:hypothetical protein
MSSELKNKMQQYEVTPSTWMWERIAAAIDDAHLSENFPVKLYEYEQAPPADAWNKISSQLTDTIEEGKAIALPKRNWNFLKYAAAAVLTGLIAWSAFILFHKTKEQNSFAVKTNPVINAPQQTDTANTSVMNNEAKNITTADTKINKSNLATALVRNNSSSLKERNLNSPVALVSSSADNDRFNLPVGHLQPAVAVNTDVSLVDGNRYFTMINPDGYIVRISKKISDIICCLYNSPSDVNSPCKEQVDKWREKVAKAPINGTPGSFMDIVDFINCIEDN